MLFNSFKFEPFIHYYMTQNNPLINIDKHSEISNRRLSCYSKIIHYIN